MTVKLTNINNKAVQLFITYSNNQCSKQVKEQRLELLENELLKQDIYLDDLFPMKQYKVLEHIIYCLSANGIMKTSIEHLAIKLEVSERTVSNCIKSLKATDQFLFTRLKTRKTNNGKLVIIDKLNSNFTAIMTDVFKLDASQFASENATQRKLQNVDTVSMDNEKQTHNDLNDFKSKQEKDNNISLSSNEKEAVKKEIEAKDNNSIEYVKEYATNPYQIALYELINEMPYSNIIKSKGAVIALRMGSDCDMKRFIMAKKVIHSIAMRIAEGFVFKSVPAAFSKALEESLKRGKVDDKTILNNVKPRLSDKRSTPTVPLYNWLKKGE